MTHRQVRNGAYREATVHASDLNQSTLRGTSRDGFRTTGLRAMTTREEERSARDAFSPGSALCCLFVKRGKKGGEEVCNCEKKRRGVSGMYHPAACYTALARGGEGARQGRARASARAGDRKREAGGC